MNLTTLVQLIALPAILAANFAELYILVGKDDYGVHVTGKKDADGEITQMDSTAGFDEGLLCLGDNKVSREGCGDAQALPKYRQVGQFDFPRATKDPRPFLIVFPLPEKYKEITYPSPTWQIVSYMYTRSYVKLIVQCNITVTGEGQYAWSPTEGWLGLSTNDAIKVDCGKQLKDQYIQSQRASVSQWEKELWAVSDAAEEERALAELAETDPEAASAISAGRSTADTAPTSA